MKTAIITGASSGLGIKLALAAEKKFPEIECFWLVARREDRLRETAAKLKTPCTVLSLDLSCMEGCEGLLSALEREKPDVRLLINNAGFGILGDVASADYREQAGMVDVNIRALTAITTMTLPYMTSGARILNVSSIASFCPNPRMTVYSSTKAYVSSFTRGLSEELRDRGISVTAVCPGPMDTEFLSVARINGNSKMFKTLPYCDPRMVAEGAINACASGRVFYTPKLFYGFYRFVAKVLPQSLVVKFATT